MDLEPDVALAVLLLQLARLLPPVLLLPQLVVLLPQPVVLPPLAQVVEVRSGSAVRVAALTVCSW